MQYLYLFVFVFALSAGLTELLRLLSKKLGFVSRPIEDRWSKRCVPLGGGVVLSLGLLIALLFVGDGLLFKLGPACLVVFILGLVDDIWGVNPPTKLIGQTVAACLVVSQGFVLPLPWQIAGMTFTILWIVGVSNAVNLIDNMDGLAAGVSLIATLSILLLFSSQSESAPMILLAVIVAALLTGFLVHNYYPARIFMGDAGSLPLGFILGVLTTQLNITGSSGIPFMALAPIVLVLIVPVFDVALVLVARGLASRPLMLGGKDHSSHRLVGLGLSEPRAVWVLYGLSLLGGLAAFSATMATTPTAILISVGTLVSFVLLGLFLLEIPVYPAKPKEIIAENIRSWREAPTTLPTPVLFVIEVGLDICVVAFVWTLAHMLRFQDERSVYLKFREVSLLPTLPLLIPLKLSCFSVFRLYRGLWRKIIVHDVYHIFQAVTIATLLLIAGSAFAVRIEGLSRTVLLLDWLLTFIGVLGVRAAISLFRRWFRQMATKPFKAVLLGSSSLSELVEEAVEQETGIAFAGVVTPYNEPLTQPGAKVLGIANQLESIVDEQQIDIIFVATNHFDDLLSALAAKGTMVRQLKVSV